ncbi:ABC transporter ATP-binding protein [Sessilibacter corallicola]|uniref:ABC transporter ATP-binding protein n=1 Tax=Sessilibacter corallicola TaxID=2904075 RepID=UPI001E43290A|nr:ATP-binding cassette domain-containing protein [Sessilibacter corallicola]
MSAINGFHVQNLFVCSRRAEKKSPSSQSKNSDQAQGVRLNVPELTLTGGEFISVVGPNGAGKSTLLHCLAGGIECSGSVMFCGLDVAKARHQNSSTLVESMAVLPQSNSVEFNFSVSEILAFSFLTRALSSELLEFIQALACAITKVEPFLSLPITQLSGGEQQRVHLARVIMQILPALCNVNFNAVKQLAQTLGVDTSSITDKDTQLLAASECESPCLLLDEPCSSLDLEFQLRIQRYLKQLTELGLTVILVTHDLNAALYYSDQVLLMNAGAVFAQGEPSDVLNSNNIQQVFHIHAELMTHHNRQWLVFH